MDELTVEVLQGKTLTAVEAHIGGDRVSFVTTTGETYILYHVQDCCESVVIDDIVGDLQDLVGSPLLIARQDSHVPAEGHGEGGYSDESFTWTFYNFATVKGYVTIKWYGSSNGWYSESVSFGLA